MPTEAPPAPAPLPSVDAGGGQPPAASNAAAEGGGAGTTTVDTGRSEGAGAERGSEDGAGPPDAEKAAAAEEAQANLEASVRADIVAKNEGPEAALHQLADINYWKDSPGARADTDSSVAEEPAFRQHEGIEQSEGELKNPDKSHRPAPISQEAQDQRIQEATAVREGEAQTTDKAVPAAQAVDAEHPAAQATAADQEQPAAPSEETTLQTQQRQEQAKAFLDRANRRGEQPKMIKEIKNKLREEARARKETVNEKQLDQQARNEYYDQKSRARFLTEGQEAIEKRMAGNESFQSLTAQTFKTMTAEAVKNHIVIDELWLATAQLEAEIRALAQVLQGKDQAGGWKKGVLYLVALLLKEVFGDVIEPTITGKQQR